MPLSEQAQSFVYTFVFPPEFVGVSLTNEALARLNGRHCQIFTTVGGHTKSVTPTICYVGLDEIDGARTIIVVLNLMMYFERDVKELTWTESQGWLLHYLPVQGKSDTIPVHFLLFPRT